MKKIAIMGSGVVRSEIAKGFHRLGNDVLFYDISQTFYLKEHIVGGSRNKTPELRKDLL
jgi:pyruvate/2-oxoglutarate dehydrogenase complex dihydrolipoamide dehydrogenase (E3) component